MWLVRGPLWGQLCGPRQRGLAVCLLKEEKHHSGLLIQPHLGAPGSAASVCPGSLAQITQSGGPGTSQGAALAPKSKQGWTSRSKVAQETAWALPLKMAVISALEGGKTSGIPHAQSLHPNLSHPLFPPRDCESFK